MGSSFTTIKNLSNEYKDYPPGCIQCPKNYKPGNPGTFEDLHKKFDNLEVKNFEGARLVVKKILSKHFDATHTLLLNPKAETLYKTLNHKKEVDREHGYKFGVSYTGLKKVNSEERYPVISGDIKPNGDLNASFVHTIGCRLRVKLSTQIKQNKYEKLKTSMEYRSDDFTFTATLIDPSILKQEGLLLLQYLQSITTRIALGVEIASKMTSNSLEGNQANLAGAFRYSSGFRTLTTTVGQAGLRVCYHHRQSHDLQMGVELQFNFVTKENKAKILYQLNPPAVDWNFRGFFDSKGVIGGVFEKKLYPLPEASLLLSALMDHNKQDVSVGFGLNIG